MAYSNFFHLPRRGLRAKMTPQNVERTIFFCIQTNTRKLRCLWNTNREFDQTIFSTSKPIYANQGVSNCAKSFFYLLANGIFRYLMEYSLKKSRFGASMKFGYTNGNFKNWDIPLGLCKSTGLLLGIFRKIVHV